MSYDPYRTDVQKIIREDLKEIRGCARNISKASSAAEKLMSGGKKVNPDEWVEQMEVIRKMSEQILWILCEKRGRFV